jgi:hypothetical protein
MGNRTAQQQSAATQPQTEAWIPINSPERYDGQEDWKAAMKEQWDAQSQAIANNPALGTPITQEEINRIWEQMSSEQQSVVSPGHDGRQPGTSGADEGLLRQEDYAVVQWAKGQYSDAQARYDQAMAAGDTAAAEAAMADMNAAHLTAEQVRQAYGYSGGVDGSMYLTGWGGQNGGGRVSGVGGSSGGSGSSTNLRSLLEEWRRAALEENNGAIDYEVQRAVTALERALADAQPQFREQVEGVARDELQGLDNSALYAEARGDRGGIGQAQYNEIQAQAAENRLAVQQAQTRLSTDTARQIEDLRAKGEFEKADGALKIAQSYLGQLVSLEQWAAELQLSREQFQQSVRQWEAQYQLSMQQFLSDQQLSYAQMTGRLGDGTPTLALQQLLHGQQMDYAQLTGQLGDGTPTLEASRYQQEHLSQLGYALLEMGMRPSGEQLAAMGMSEGQADEYLMAWQLQQAVQNSASKGSGGKSGSSSGGKKSTMSLTTAKQAAQAGVFNDAVLQTLRENGYTDDMLEAIYGYGWSNGYSTQRNTDGMKASEWDMVKQNIIQNLRAGKVAEVEAYMEQVGDGMSKAQWNEIAPYMQQYGFADFPTY